MLSAQWRDVVTRQASFPAALSLRQLHCADTALQISPAASCCNLHKFHCSSHDRLQKRWRSYVSLIGRARKNVL